MSKVLIPRGPYLYPRPVVLLGSMVHGKPDYNVVCSCAVISFQPPMITVTSHGSHYVNVGVREHGTLSINIPSSSLAVPTDYCGITSGRDTDKSQVFTSFFGETGAPMISECPICMECRVQKTVDLDGTDLFVVEVISVYADDSVLVDGKPDIGLIDPFVYAMGGGYRRIGAECAKPFQAGKEYRAPAPIK